MRRCWGRGCMRLFLGRSLVGNRRFCGFGSRRICGSGRRVFLLGLGLGLMRLLLGGGPLRIGLGRLAAMEK